MWIHRRRLLNQVNQENHNYVILFLSISFMYSWHQLAGIPLIDDVPLLGSKVGEEHGG